MTPVQILSVNRAQGTGASLAFGEVLLESPSFLVGRRKSNDNRYFTESEIYGANVAKLRLTVLATDEGGYRAVGHLVPSAEECRHIAELMMAALERQEARTPQGNGNGHANGQANANVQAYRIPANRLPESVLAPTDDEQPPF